jgi:putative tryptophan/tyrosine transport system substrate-binding protein
MRRRAFIALFGGLAAVWPFTTRAQQKAMPVIGFLSGVSPGAWASYLAAFSQKLSEAGYVQGQTVTIEYRWAEGKYDRLPALAADLVSRKVDVIAATGGPIAAHAAKAATSTIPIVFATGGDPVAEHLVDNLDRPGGNLTGLTVLVADLMPKRLELLLELVPRAKTIALLVNPGNPNTERISRKVTEAARTKGIELPILNAANEREIKLAFASLAQHRADALLVGSDAFFNNQREQLVGLAARYRVPAMYDIREFVDAGGLISLGVSVQALYQEIAVYVAKILAGAKPADLPVERPSKFELVINLKAAKELGLTVPQSLLARADEVIA